MSEKVELHIMLDLFLLLQAFCESHCSHLAVFWDQNDLRHALDAVSHDDVISSLVISYYS